LVAVVVHFCLGRSRTSRHAMVISLSVTIRNIASLIAGSAWRTRVGVISRSSHSIAIDTAWKNLVKQEGCSGSLKEFSFGQKRGPRACQ
jgi:hypothetical protein